MPRLGVAALLLFAACGCTRRAPFGLLPAEAPRVASTVPASGSAGIEINQPISATFSQPMDPATIDASTFHLRRGSVDVPGTVRYSDMTAVFIPTDRLAPNATFTATLAAGSKDTVGEALEADHSWTFTTGGGGDLPDISATQPLNGAGGVGPGQEISVTFNEAMDPTTLTASTFSLRQGTAEVPGAVAYDAASNRATFAPTAPLGPSQSFDAVISIDAKSASGRGLTTPYSWTFTTAAGPITVVAPANRRPPRQR